MKKLEYGRSMVEMLGVLAIIGILSVGAIAGYQKAMLKYKLNKQAQQLNQVINAVAKYHQSFRELAIKEKNKNLMPYFKKLGEIPKEMIKVNDEKHIYDVFGTRISIVIEGYDGDRIALYMYPELIKVSDNNLKICQNIITTAKENSANITYLETLATKEGNSDPSYTSLQGDTRCTGYKCLRNVTLDDIQRLCIKTQQKDSALKIHWLF